MPSPPMELQPLKPSRSNEYRYLQTICRQAQQQSLPRLIIIILLKTSFFLLISKFRFPLPILPSSPHITYRGIRPAGIHIFCNSHRTSIFLPFPSLFIVFVILPTICTIGINRAFLRVKRFATSVTGFHLLPSFPLSRSLPLVIPSPIGSLIP